MYPKRIRVAARAAQFLALILLPAVESARPLAEQLPLDATGSIDYAKLERVRTNSRYSGTLTELAEQLVVEADLHIASASERLYYKCQGLAIQPGSALAATLAAEAAAYDAFLLAEPSILTDPAAAAAAGVIDPLAAAAGVIDPLAAAGMADPVSAATAGVTDPVAAAAYLNSTETGAEVLPGQPDASAAYEYGRRLRVHGHDHHQHHHHHHHHHQHHRHLTALLNTDELPSPWKPNMPDPALGVLTVTAAFTLHSRPSSANKIYLDFNGHTTSGTWWNEDFTSGAPIVTPPYNRPEDGAANVNVWSARELLDVFAIWRGVSEDFAAFDVDVTTEEPAAAVLLSNGIRVCIGGDDTWVGGAGGIAYLWSFGGGQPLPAFVFPDSLGPFSVKAIRMATSHEVGHTLGLRHDGIRVGTKTFEYYQENTQWGPIMGAPYSSRVIQWSKGGYTGATQLEDDIQMMINYVGAASDVHGNGLAAATSLTGETSAGTTRAQVAGIIRSASDTDWLKFDAAPGVLTIQILCVPGWGTELRSTLNMQADLMNSQQQVLATRSGIGISSFTYTVPTTGTFYLSIRGIGAASATTTPGYSSYGSVGQYQALLSYPATSTVVCATAPSANPTNGAFSCSTTTPAGSVCTATCAVGFGGSPSVTCLQDGTWSAIVGSCVRVCAGNPTLANGAFSCGTNSPVGRVCNGTCSTGFIGSPRVVCQDDSTWSALEGSCQRACTTSGPTAPSGGSYSCRPTLVGATCSATCSAGFIPGPSGAPTATCLTTGAWSGTTTGTCVRVCSTSPTAVPANANPFQCSPTSLVNARCVAACRDGFAAGTAGAPTVTCGSTGAWSSTVTGSCVAVCRNAPANPANGAFSCPTNITAGKTCTAQCNSGHSGAPTVTCSSTGTWGAISGTCAPVCAIQPPAVANAVFACPITNRNSRCTATCARGFRAGTTGAPFYVCSASNTWSSLRGSCIPVVCTTAPPTRTRTTWPTTCSRAAGSVCTGICSQPRTNPATATCTLASSGTSASWIITGTC